MMIGHLRKGYLESLEVIDLFSKLFMMGKAVKVEMASLHLFRPNHPCLIQTRRLAWWPMWLASCPWNEVKFRPLPFRVTTGTYRCAFWRETPTQWSQSISLFWSSKVICQEESHKIGKFGFGNLCSLTVRLSRYMMEYPIVKYNKIHKMRNLPQL